MSVETMTISDFLELPWIKAIDEVPGGYLIWLNDSWYFSVDDETRRFVESLDEAAWCAGHPIEVYHVDNEGSN